MKLIHQHSPYGKGLNTEFPNLSSHKRDTIQLRRLPLCHRLGRVRDGQVCCVEQTQWAQDSRQSFQTGKECMGETFLPGKSLSLRIILDPSDFLFCPTLSGIQWQLEFLYLCVHTFVQLHGHVCVPVYTDRRLMVDALHNLSPPDLLRQGFYPELGALWFR